MLSVVACSLRPLRLGRQVRVAMARRRMRRTCHHLGERGWGGHGIIYEKGDGEGWSFHLS